MEHKLAIGLTKKCIWCDRDDEYATPAKMYLPWLRGTCMYVVVSSLHMEFRELDIKSRRDRGLYLDSLMADR
jgi:hypothetical protein